MPAPTMVWRPAIPRARASPGKATSGTSAPSGQGKDYGFGLALFNNKLVLRLNWYEETNQNATSNAANTVVGRVQRIDTASTHRWAEYVVRIRSGQNPTTENDFDNNTSHP